MSINMIAYTGRIYEAISIYTVTTFFPITIFLKQCMYVNSRYKLVTLVRPILSNDQI